SGSPPRARRGRGRRRPGRARARVRAPAPPRPRSWLRGTTCRSRCGGRGRRPGSGDRWEPGRATPAVRQSPPSSALRAHDVYTIDGMSTFERHVLDNGLRILTADLPHAQSVTCMVMIAAGSRYETAETNGIAHFSEHMFFKGTERRPDARTIAGEIDAIGGEFNAFTSKESTAYYVKCAAEHRDVALDVLVDMLRNSRFDGSEIDREKGVILEEMNMYFDTPRDYIGGVYDELLYGDQPLGWDIIGRKETVRAANRDTFLSYLERWYHPERMVVGLAGAIGDDAVERVSQLLGDLPAAKTGAPSPVQGYENGRVKVFTKASEQAHVIVGVP